jgi:hypothetical protein
LDNDGLLHNHWLLLHHLRLDNRGWRRGRLTTRDAGRIGNCRLPGVNVNDLGRRLPGLDDYRRGCSAINHRRRSVLVRLASSERERAEC